MEEQVRNVMIAELGLSPDVDFNNLKYGDTRAWDSSGHLNLVVALEETFGVTFDSDEIVKLHSFTEICSLIAQKQAV